MSAFTTFKDAYSTLQRNATTLRSQQEPNIDELLPLVQQSMDAFRVCKERIDAVEAAMKVEFGESPEGAQDSQSPVSGQMHA